MMTAQQEHIDDIIDIYALGVLEPSEQGVADEHLRSCARCRELLDESERVVAALAWTAEQHEPPADLRARVMARAQQVRPSVPIPASGRSAPSKAPKAWWRQLSEAPKVQTPVLARRALGLGAVVLLLALAGNTIRLQGQVQQTQKEAAAQQQIIDAVRAPGARVVAFSGTATSGHSQLVVNAAGNQAFLLTDGLPALPPDKAYQLWLIHGQQPVASNVFQVDQQGRVTIQVQVPAQIKDYQAAGITVEPAGGSTAPTTKPFLLGQF